jgi:23S rRNA pseudouridine1911/1915/1917 synthase
LSDLPRNTSILADDPDFLILAKPPGMETISLDGGPELTAAARTALGEPGLAPVHRLDRDTSGAQIFARNPEAEAALADLFRRRLVDKTYLALTLGTPRNRTGTINRNLSEWSGGRRPVRVVRRGGLAAATAYEVLAPARDAGEGLPVGLLAFSPHQGRTHQIRVHAASLGYPILGDDQYGNRPANRLAKKRLGIARQALHARRLAFDWRGRRIEIDCPLPADMATAAEKTFGKGEW